MLANVQKSLKVAFATFLNGSFFLPSPKFILIFLDLFSVIYVIFSCSREKFTQTLWCFFWILCFNLCTVWLWLHSWKIELLFIRKKGTQKLGRTIDRPHFWKYKNSTWQVLEIEMDYFFFDKPVLLFVSLWVTGTRKYLLC